MPADGGHGEAGHPALKMFLDLKKFLAKFKHVLMQAAAKVPRRRTAIIGKVSNKNEFASTHFCTPMITIQPSRII